MSYTTINKSSLHMNTKLYTGTGSSNSVTGVGFQPDMTWFKHRNGTSEHNIYDAVRGATKRIIPNDNSAEGTQSNGLSAFGSDGFTVVDSNATNLNNGTYASWNWKANGAGSANTDGSINSTVSVNQTAGFSIVKWTGTQSLGTVGHGLNSVPKMIIIKNTSALENWIVYHNSLGNTKNLYLDATNAEHTRSDTFNNTSPTSSVFTVNTATGVNKTGSTMIAYCFAEKTAYSKISSYVGNNSTDGTFIYTGFKPQFILIKNKDAVASWRLVDNKRIGYNPNNIQLYPNLTNAESTSEYVVDILSNGFKVIATDSGVNGSGNTMIYIAIGQSLVGDNNVPCTAR